MERPTHEHEFGGIRVRIENPAPRKGLRILAGAAKVLGEYLVNILTEGGIRKSIERVDGTIDDVLIPISALLTDPRERVKIAGAVLSAIGRMDPDDAVSLCESLLLGQAKVAREKAPEGMGWAWVDLTDDNDGAERIDSMFPSYFALIGACRWAFSCYFLPTLAVPATSENSSTGDGE